MSREHLAWKLIKKLCKKSQEKTSKSDAIDYIMALIFSEFILLKNPDRVVILSAWSRVITSLPGYQWAIMSGR
jgi:hypothetical protein